MKIKKKSKWKISFLLVREHSTQGKRIIIVIIKRYKKILNFGMIDSAFVVCRLSSAVTYFLLWLCILLLRFYYYIVFFYTFCIYIKILMKVQTPIFVYFRRFYCLNWVNIYETLSCLLQPWIECNWMKMYRKLPVPKVKIRLFIIFLVNVTNDKKKQEVCCPSNQKCRCSSFDYTISSVRRQTKRKSGNK